CVGLGFAFSLCFAFGCRGWRGGVLGQGLTVSAEHDAVAGARGGGVFGGEGFVGGVFWGGVKGVLHGGGPAIILGFASVGIDVVVIVNEHAAGGGVFAGLMIAAVASGETFAIDPVGAVEVRVVEETHGGK